MSKEWCLLPDSNRYDFWSTDFKSVVSTKFHQAGPRATLIISRPPFNKNYTCLPILCDSLFLKPGGVPEWLNGAVSKTVVRLKRTVGSNPTSSATRRRAKRYGVVSRRS